MKSLPEEKATPDPQQAAVRGKTEAAAGKYARLGYKRLILDYHYSEFVPHTLANANSKEIVDAMAYLGVDSLLLYAKDCWGIVYHDTRISHKHANVRCDLFGEVSRGLLKRGIRTIGYFQVGWEELTARAHPEWRVVNASGGPVRDGGTDPTAGKWTWLCLNTPYREYALAQIQELIANYDMEALFLDCILYWPGASNCYCDCCQELWRGQYGAEIPKPFSPEDTARYMDFFARNTERFYAQVKDIIKAAGKDIWLTHNPEAASFVQPPTMAFSMVWTTMWSWRSTHSDATSSVRAISPSCSGRGSAEGKSNSSATGTTAYGISRSSPPSPCNGRRPQA
jgi:hypothetical protein